MSLLSHRSPSLWVGLAALVLGGALSTRSTGVQSGVNSIPVAASRSMPSCSACHSGSAPFAGRINGPTASLTVGARVLSQGQQIPVTVDGTGGISSTFGGFLCETTGGTFTAGAGNHINGIGNSVTHNDRTRRSWSFTYTAPNNPGVVEMTAAVNTVNGSGSGGDMFAFAGFDNNATIATPVRLYVLPTGVTNFGSGCPDGYANIPVLGANGTPAVGNAAFALGLHGAAPSTLAFLLMGFNPAGFTGLDLGALFGITGCTGYVANPSATATAFTSAGDVMRAEGAATFGFPLPNWPSLLGFAIDIQAAFIDTSVARAVPVTFTNGLRMVVQ